MSIDFMKMKILDSLINVTNKEEKFFLKRRLTGAKSVHLGSRRKELWLTEQFATLVTMWEPIHYYHATTVYFIWAVGFVKKGSIILYTVMIQRIVRYMSEHKKGNHWLMQMHLVTLNYNIPALHNQQNTVVENNIQALS